MPVTGPNGSGSLYIRQIYDETGNPVNDVFHAADPLLLDVNLGLMRMASVSGGAAPAANPANWNGLMIRTANNGGLDNINISTDPITGAPQWALNAAGNWNSKANWYPGTVPNGIGAQAMLGTVISADRTVFTDTPVTLGNLNFNNTNAYVIGGAGSFTLQVSTGSAQINVSQGTQKINLPLIIASDTIANVAAGATLVIGNPVTINANKTLTKNGNVVIQAPLTVLSSGAMVLNSGSTTLFTAPSLASGAKIDVKSNTLTI